MALNGTYTLNGDCTGTLTETDNDGAVSHYDIFVLSNGSQLTFVETDEGYVASGIERRS